MSFKITPNVAIAAISAAAAEIEVGDTEEFGSLSIWSGPVPDNALDIIDVEVNDILATTPLPSPTFGLPSEISENLYGALGYAITGVIGLTTGIATFFRIYNRDGDPVFQGEVSEDTSESLQVNQINITEGAEVNIIRTIITQSLG